MLPVLTLALIVSDSPDAAPCPGATTIEVDACLASRFDEADADLNRYYDEAIRRVRREGEETLAENLIQAQRSWMTYRDSECGAIFEKYRDGTIRTSMEFGCRIRLTQTRTFMIWRNWLTYPDSTPPLLPRPNIDSGSPVDG